MQQVKCLSCKITSSRKICEADFFSKINNRENETIV